MMKKLAKQKFLIVGLIGLIIVSLIDINQGFLAVKLTWSSVLSMMIIVPPIFLLIGLFDVWVPRETVIKLMGEKSGAKGMLLAFFLGAFSAGPTIAAFPIALLMIRKGARYSNVLFFLMVWSSLKLPIVFYQIAELGIKFSMVINLTMLTVFIISALIAEKLHTKEELEAYIENANQLSI